jgi:hypothetical protein
LVLTDVAASAASATDTPVTAFNWAS